jgi:hypothetical protein
MSKSGRPAQRAPVVLLAALALVVFVTVLAVSRESRHVEASAFWELSAVVVPAAAAVPVSNAASVLSGGAAGGLDAPAGGLHAPVMVSDEVLMASASALAGGARGGPAAAAGRRQRQPALFLHIHKAGGSSVCRVAAVNGESTWRQSNCNAAGARERVALARGEPAEQARAVQGRSFVANEWATPRELWDGALWTTMLRNPVARSESHFAMSLAQSQEELGRRGPAALACKYGPAWVVGLVALRDARAAKAAGEVLRAEELRLRLLWLKAAPDNWQLRALCGADCKDVPFGKLTREHLAAAKRRLASFHVVGLLEEYRHSVALMGHILGWAKPAGSGSASASTLVGNGSAAAEAGDGTGTNSSAAQGPPAETQPLRVVGVFSRVGTWHKSRKVVDEWRAELQLAELQRAELMQRQREPSSSSPLPPQQQQQQQEEQQASTPLESPEEDGQAGKGASAQASAPENPKRGEDRQVDNAQLLAEVMRWITTVNLLDAELYNFAVRIFLAQVEALRVSTPALARAGGRDVQLLQPAPNNASLELALEWTPETCSWLCHDRDEAGEAREAREPRVASRKVRLERPLEPRHRTCLGPDRSAWRRGSPHNCTVLLASRAELDRELAEYSDQCLSQCCAHHTCAPLGQYWTATALKLGLIPPPRTSCG